MIAKRTTPGVPAYWVTIRIDGGLGVSASSGEWIFMIWWKFVLIYEVISDVTKVQICDLYKFLL